MKALSARPRRPLAAAQARGDRRPGSGAGELGAGAGRRGKCGIAGSPTLPRGAARGGDPAARDRRSAPGAFSFRG